jgi:hypothetical protein
MEWGLVDEALAWLKPHLAAVRKEHGVVADITYRIPYDGEGRILDVQIISGPGDLSAEFVAAARHTLFGRLRIPRSTEAGILDFTDLGPESKVDAGALNAGMDLERYESRQLQKRKERKLVIALLVGMYVLYALALLAGAL